MDTLRIPPEIEAIEQKLQNIRAYNASILDNYCLHLKLQEKRSERHIEDIRLLLETFGDDYLANHEGRLIVEGAMDIWPFVWWYEEKMMGEKPSKKEVRDTVRAFFHWVIDDFSKLSGSPSGAARNLVRACSGGANQI